MGLVGLFFIVGGMAGTMITGAKLWNEFFFEGDNS